MAESNRPPVWYRHWFQFLLGALLVLAVAGVVVPPLLAVLYAARSVLVPLLIALALAYAVNPLVNWMQARLKVPRPMSAVLIMLAVGVVFASLLIYLAPTLYNQSSQLINSAQRYAEELTEHVDMDEIRARLHEAVNDTLGRGGEGSAESAAPSPDGEATSAAEPRSADAGQATPSQTPDPAPQAAATTPPPDTAATKASGVESETTATVQALESVDIGSLYKGIVGALDVGFGVVTTAIGMTSYFALAALIIVFCFFFFVWKFPAVKSFFVPFIPIQYRDRTLELLGMMDQSVSGFIRGRLIQVTCISVVLSFGWWLAGVPYWLLLGILGGTLNLIPYAAIIAWPLAVLLAWLHGLSNDDAFSFWAVVFWPSIVYFIAQSLDGWVIEPLVQGKATDLDPLTVLLCVLIGGSLLGLLGMLIAIPVTACIKILMREVILPHLRRLAADRESLV